MPLDEGPSPEDIARFSGESAYCPECGAEVWDGAPVCPECGVVAGRWLSRPREVHDVEHRMRNVIIMLVVLGLLLPFLWFLFR